VAKNKIGYCPTTNCSGGSPGRQVPMTEQQIARIMGAAPKINETSVGGPLRCNYCGAVYRKNPSPEILGFLDNGILGDGWHPKVSG
jgi:hypothetical protein